MPDHLFFSRFTEGSDQHCYQSVTRARYIRGGLHSHRKCIWEYRARGHFFIISPAIVNLLYRSKKNDLFPPSENSSLFTSTTSIDWLLPARIEMTVLLLQWWWCIFDRSDMIRMGWICIYCPVRRWLSQLWRVMYPAKIDAACKFLVQFRQKFYIFDEMTAKLKYRRGVNLT